MVHYSKEKEIDGFISEGLSKPLISMLPVWFSLTLHPASRMVIFFRTGSVLVLGRVG